MNENIKADEEKNKTIKIEENKTNSSIPKTYLLEEDSQHTKKKYIKFISIKKCYFKVENNPISYKKKPYIIQILTMEDGQKKKGINLFKELYYMESIGKKLKV